MKVYFTTEHSIHRDRLNTVLHGHHLAPITTRKHILVSWPIQQNIVPLTANCGNPAILHYKNLTEMQNLLENGLAELQRATFRNVNIYTPFYHHKFWVLSYTDTFNLLKCKKPKYFLTKQCEGQGNPYHLFKESNTVEMNSFPYGKSHMVQWASSSIFIQIFLSKWGSWDTKNCIRKIQYHVHSVPHTSSGDFLWLNTSL